MNCASILRKARACLRLAASSNAHEAGTALHQAYAMLEQLQCDPQRALESKEATCWRPITDAQPVPLVDVLVSALQSNGECLVYQAWRRGVDLSQFLLTSTEDPVPGRVYAYAEEPVPADPPIDLLESAGLVG